jgi:hypothetical protein
MSSIHRYVTAVVVLATLCLLPSEARGQAWVPARGEGAVAVAFQSMNVKKHLSATTPADVGPIDTQVVLTDFTYGLTDKIAIDVALPLVTSKYTGNRPHPGTDIDDGAYRSAFTDVRFALRYNLTRDGAVVTPYVGTIVPSHDYAFYGHAAPGQHLRELQVGVYAAKLIERGLPGMFVSGRYGFGFLEQVLDISHNRSIADIEVGYFFTSELRAFVNAHGQYSHGGIDFPLNGLAGLPLALRENHDQIQKVHAFEMGAGAAYSITESLDVFGSFSRLVAGRNGHALNRGITIGASWSFRRKNRAADAVTAAASAPAITTATGAAATARREGTLLRCICQKSGS